MITCVAVDDEPLALEVIENYVKQTPGMELKHAFTSPLAAMEYLKKNPVDLLLLDINMPQVSGIQMLKSLTNAPPVIFTTAYSKYAVEGFELDAIDFLLKPIAYERFLKAVNKASEYLNYAQKNAPADASTFMFIKADYRIVKVNFDEIQCVEGMDDYVKIYVNDKMLVSNMTMKDLLKRLPAASFARVHRSYIVPLNRIESIRNKRIKIGDRQIPIGDSYSESFFKLLGERG